jgi:hypothetical protein
MVLIRVHQRSSAVKMIWFFSVFLCITTCEILLVPRRIFIVAASDLIRVYPRKSAVKGFAWFLVALPRCVTSREVLSVPRRILLLDSPLCSSVPLCGFLLIEVFLRVSAPPR